MGVVWKWCRSGVEVVWGRRDWSGVEGMIEVV